MHKQIPIGGSHYMLSAIFGLLLGFSLTVAISPTAQAYVVHGCKFATGTIDPISWRYFSSKCNFAAGDSSPAGCENCQTHRLAVGSTMASTILPRHIITWLQGLKLSQPFRNLRRCAICKARILTLRASCRRPKAVWRAETSQMAVY